MLTNSIAHGRTDAKENAFGGLSQAKA